MVSIAARRRGFTLIELIVVMVIIALLLTIAVPHYFTGLQRSKEAALRQDLSVMRDALDKFHADRGVYPETLNELVTQRYLRRIPEDPLTESAESWIVVAPPQPSKRRRGDDAGLRREERCGRQGRRR